MGFPTPLGQKVYVKPPATPGDLAGGAGTETNPFRSVTKGIQEAGLAGTVLLHSGHYVESVKVHGVTGVIVQPFGDGEVFIDSMLPEFLAPTAAGHHWVRLPAAQGGAADGLEYYWNHRFEHKGSKTDNGRVMQGAFLDDGERYNRLITYGEAGDFRAANEKWPRTGENVCWKPDPDHAHMYVHEDRPNIRPLSRPWVYMGPGIWFDEDDRDPGKRGPDDVGGRLAHVRLAPTHNNIDGWPDYHPANTNPNAVGLALCLELNYAIFLTDCHKIRFTDLTLRFGSPDTVRLNRCTDVVFDHCRIRSGGRAVNLMADGGNTERISIAHCEIDGGIPTWMFRSDRKDVYLLGPPGKTHATEDEVRRNTLGSATSSVQLTGQAGVSDVTVHHCDIFHAHDSYIFGKNMKFHHNWIRNLNDDGIALSGDAKTQNAEIYCNVITKCLTALSFATQRDIDDIYIYGNLIDIREPTLGIRPDGDGPPDALRQGHFFKDGGDERHIELFHNTCLVRDPGAKGDVFTDIKDAGFGYYATLGNSLPRNAYNNIMVAIYTEELRPIAFLPPKDFPCATDGNTYFRIPEGDAVDTKFLVRWRIDDHLHESGEFPSLLKFQEKYWHEDEVPYEHDGILEDPQFRSFDTVTGRPRLFDDLRLNRQRTSKRSIVEMPDQLSDMMEAATGLPPTDRGCFPADGARLRVGVNELRVYPRPKPISGPDTHDPDLPPVI
jgi:hypothetical protein